VENPSEIMPQAHADVLRALVVDDNEELLVCYTRILTKAGYAVTSAINGVRALDALHAGQFNVLLSDIAMPGGMSGIELLERIRSEGTDIPVILATGNPGMDTAVKAVENGVLRYLAKPVDPRMLVQVVGEAVHLHGLARIKRLALDNDALRILIEDLSRAREGAHAASLAKSDFLAKVSHELRTPMCAIMGYADLALDCELPSDARGYVETVKRAGEGLLALIQNVLDFADLDRGTLPLRARAFELRDVIETAVQPFAARARAKGLAFVSDVDRGVPETVVGDSERLRQILESLVGNALQFTCAGEIRVHVDLESRAGADLRLRVSVRDTGMGIREDAMGHVVKAFSQADDSVTRRHGGAGLGLTIATKLVELMEGEIAIESAPNVGTTVRLTVRLRAASAREIEQTRPRE
jgi:signal transduction histidine kinase